MTIPFAYLYILLILLRELCFNFPDNVYDPIKHYVPLLANVVGAMEQSSVAVETWCIIEALFYLVSKLQIYWLQSRDPLEASLSSAPMLELDERELLWNRIMDCEKDDPVTHLQGWFFDEPIDKISKYDVRDFISWSMFECRNQEHLTGEELAQLDRFMDEFEYHISIFLYGAIEDDSDENEQHNVDFITRLQEDQKDDDSHLPTEGVLESVKNPEGKPVPKKRFHFHDSRQDDPPNFFTNLYENHKHRYEQYRNMLDNSDIHPVQDLRNFMAETRQTIVDAEENAVARATQMSEMAYHSLISPGSNMDKQLTAISHAAQNQITEAKASLNDAWNSVIGVKERLETADFLVSRKKLIIQRLNENRKLLGKMMKRSSTVPSKQMAHLMRKITDCNDALAQIEHSARESFVSATGYARNLLPLSGKEPQRYAKYSSDPLLGVQTYPLIIHILILSIFEGGLRVMMNNRGFERHTVGRISYYYHPGVSTDDMKEHNGEDNNDVDCDESQEDEHDDDNIPLVFVHGIGVGLIPYMPLIDGLLKTGRPILLPELPFVTGFRIWQGPNAVLRPDEVTNAVMAMLATHGYYHGVFLGHSYGTSWLSYMLKKAPDAIAAVLFLDPICFCLHVPRLTKQFVYVRADPGTISYMVRTDIITNWTIQRSFPWSWIILFAEQINVPCSVFLSELDALVPSERVEKYLRLKGAPVMSADEADKEHFGSGDITVTVLKGELHGDWTERPSRIPKIIECVDALYDKATVRS